MADQQLPTISKARIFIGSSTPNLNVARALGDCLERRGFQPLVWDQELFRQNESIFDGLRRISTDVDFAIFVWGGSDLTISDGQSIQSPRDNVMFETGLFLGALGKDKVFVVVDKAVSLKIPSDYAGITRADYDGSLIETNRISAISFACNTIESSIQSLPVPRELRVLAGQWKSCYAAGPDAAHREVIDDVVVKAEPEGILFTSGSIHGLVPYSGKGKAYYGNQIMGLWTHPSDRTLAEGLFMLTVNTAADAMYGYSTSRDLAGAMIYGTWVFAKKDGYTEAKILENLRWAQQSLKERTISPPDL